MCTVAKCSSLSVVSCAAPPSSDQWCMYHPKSFVWVEQRRLHRQLAIVCEAHVRRTFCGTSGMIRRDGILDRTRLDHCKSLLSGCSNKTQTSWSRMQLHTSSWKVDHISPILASLASCKVWNRIFYSVCTVLSESWTQYNMKMIEKPVSVISVTWWTPQCHLILVTQVGVWQYEGPLYTEPGDGQHLNKELEIKKLKLKIDQLEYEKKVLQYLKMHVAIV